MISSEYFNFINDIKFPYDSGLWIKSLNLNKINFKFYTSKEQDFTQNILESNFESLSIESINKFFKLIVDKELLIYLPEEIMIFDIFKNIFNRINHEEARKIFIDLEALSIEEHNNSENYEQIRELIFNQGENNLNFSFFSNCQPYNSFNISAKDYYYKELIQYPCCIAVSERDLIIYWSNL